MRTDLPTQALSVPRGSDLLASDRERERAVVRLRDGAAEGRLTPRELEERVERALAARTRGELASVIGDLPHEVPGAKPTRDFRGDLNRMGRQLAIYAAVNLLLIVVWAISGAGYFWPVWPLVAWGVGLAKHHFRDGGPGHRGPSRARQWSTS